MSHRRSSASQSFEPAASKPRRKWSAEEDDYLRSQVELYQGAGETVDWTKVALGLDHRTNKDCRKRWLKIDSRWSNGTWSPDEDERLRRAVGTHEGRWKSVSDEVQTRNPDQCAKRWRNSLDPQLQRNDWSLDEDELLISAVAEHGRNWKMISSVYFQSRSRLDLSNRYTMLARRHIDSQAYRGTLSTRSPSSSLPPENDESGGQECDMMAEDDMPWSRSAAHAAMPAVQSRMAGAVAMRRHAAHTLSNQGSIDAMGTEANVWGGQQMLYPSYVAVSQGSHGWVEGAKTSMKDMAGYTVTAMPGQVPVHQMNVQMCDPAVKVEYEESSMISLPTSVNGLHPSAPAYY